MKKLLKNNFTILPSLVGLILLSIAFYSLFFLTHGQRIPEFGEQNQFNVGRARLYSLIKWRPIASSKDQSRLIDEQGKISLTRLSKAPGYECIPKSRITINELVFSPVIMRDRSVNHMGVSVQVHDDVRKVESKTGRVIVKRDLCSIFNLPAIRKESNRTLYSKIAAVENPSGDDIKQEGAGGTLGDFFESGFSTPSSGVYRVEVTPRISIKGEYDDNILLVNSNRIADYSTTVSPGLKISADSGSNGLDLDYEFGWVKYHRKTRNDYVQHRGNLKAWQQVAGHLTFTIDDYFIKSNDYLADIDQLPVTQRVSHTIQAYQRNNAKAALDYQFGPKNHFILGYIYNILDNDDSTLEDARENGPFAQLSYWFTQKDGLGLSYENVRYVYDQPDYYINWRDLNAHNMRGAYEHRFGIHTAGSLYYALSIRKSIDFPIQYEIHDIGASFVHGFSPSTSLSLALGYYKPTGDTSSPGTSALAPGVTSSIDLRKRFQHGSVALGATTGWDDGLMEVIPRGFTKFGGVFGRFEYEPTENFNVFANITYRKNKYANEEIDILLNQAAGDETYRGLCGVDWTPYRWFTLRLDYTYTNRTSPDPNNEFVDNRVGLTLRAEKPFKW